MQRKDPPRFLAALLLVFTLAPSAWTQTDAAPTLDQRLDRLQRDLERARVEHHVPGMSLAVVHDDAVVLARGFGVADLESARPAGAETIYAIGSSTKAFTGLLVAQLADEGVVALDDPVTAHLPWFTLPIETTNDEDVVELRDLLGHRSGFTRMGLLWAAGRASREEVLRAALDAEPWSPFRVGFHYNNVAFTAAAHAAATSAGTDWESLVRARLLEPLGMADASLTTEAMLADERHATGYHWNPDLEEHSAVPMRRLNAIAPAGAINAHVLDVARWVRMQLAEGVLDGERIVSRDALRTSWRAVAPIGPGAGYALGWFRQRWHGGSMMQHGGNIDGFAAMVCLFPEEDLGFVLLMNVTSTPLQDASREIVWEAMTGEWDPAMLADGGATDEADEANEGDAEVPYPAAEELRPLTGRYHFAMMQDDFEVLVTQGRLTVDVPGQQVFRLEPPDADGAWAFEIDGGIRVSFHEFEDGRPTVLKLNQSGMRFDLPRVAADGGELPTAADLEALHDGDARRAALAAWGDTRITGRVRAVHQGAEGALTVWMRAADGALREEVDYGRLGTTVTCVTPDGGWTVSDFEKDREYVGRELAFARISQTASLWRGTLHLFDEPEILAVEDLEDASEGRAIVARLPHEHLVNTKAWFDAKTGDLLRMEARAPLVGELTLPVTATLSDVRVHEGARVPFRATSENRESGRTVITIEAIETGVTLPEGAFDFPGP